MNPNGQTNSPFVLLVTISGALDKNKRPLKTDSTEIGQKSRQ